MAKQRISARFYADGSVPGGNTVAGTNTETAFSSKKTIKANSLAIDDVIELELFGKYGTVTGIATTLQIKTKFGTTVLIDTGQISATLSLSNQGWWIRAKFIVTAIGASGSVRCNMHLELGTGVTTALIDNLSGGAVTIDTTADKDLQVTVQWDTGLSSASISNTITCELFDVDLKR